MKIRRLRLVVLACVTGAAVATTLSLRYYTAAQLNAWLSARYAAQLAALPPDRAVSLVRRLGSSPETALAPLVASLADDRHSVRSAAAAELSAFTERSAALPRAPRSALAAQLARQLAQAGPSLPSDSRAAAHGIARIILSWDLDGRQLDVAQLIADCQHILSQSCDEPAELRIAARPQPALLAPPDAARISNQEGE